MDRVWLILMVSRGGRVVDEGSIDRRTMGKLASALAFIRDPDDRTVVALRRAAESGAAADVKAARALFVKLPMAERRAALAGVAEE